MPRSTSPSAMSDSPTPTRARTTRSGSANLVPISTARSYAFRAASGSPIAMFCTAAATSRYPDSTRSPPPSPTRRCARGEPAGGRRHLAPREMLDGHPECAAHGPSDVLRHGPTRGTPGARSPCSPRTRRRGRSRWRGARGPRERGAPPDRPPTGGRRASAHAWRSNDSLPRSRSRVARSSAGASV